MLAARFVNSNRYYVRKVCFLFVMILIIGLLSGCASMVDGNKQSVFVQTESVKGARCHLKNSKGEWTLMKTPGFVTVNRAYGDLSLQCIKRGYQDGVISVRSSTKELSFGNILIGGILGGGIDMASGAAYDYPKVIRVPMISCDLNCDTVSTYPQREEDRVVLD